MAEDKKKDRSPGNLTQFVVYGVMLTAMYFASTPEITGNLTERQEQDFHVAAVRLKKGADDSKIVVYSLYLLKAGKVDLASVSFLLPQDVVDIPGGDTNEATVLERHPDWQLVEYHFGNTHNSVSRYRAFKDRIEPVSYRVTMHFGIFVSAIVLVIPALIVAAVINAIWNKVARRKKTPDVT